VAPIIRLDVSEKRSLASAWRLNGSKLNKGSRESYFMKISSVVVELCSDRRGIANSFLHDSSLQHVKKASDPLYRGDPM